MITSRQFSPLVWKDALCQIGFGAVICGSQFRESTFGLSFDTLALVQNDPAEFLAARHGGQPALNLDAGN